MHTNGADGWIDGAIATISGIVLWVISWIRQGIKENRDTHEKLQRQLDRIERHTKKAPDPEE